MVGIESSYAKYKQSMIKIDKTTKNQSCKVKKLIDQLNKAVGLINTRQKDIQKNYLNVDPKMVLQILDQDTNYKSKVLQ